MAKAPILAAILALLVLVACSDPAPTAVVAPTAIQQPQATVPAENQPEQTQPSSRPDPRTNYGVNPTADRGPYNGVGTNRDRSTCHDSQARPDGNRGPYPNTHGNPGHYIDPDARGHDSPHADTDANNHAYTGANRRAALRRGRIPLFALS